MDAEVGELATAAATTVVKLLATSGWEQARNAVTALWRRRHPERVETVAAELDEGRAELVAAPEAEAELVTEWNARLRRLAGGDTSGADELRALIETLTPLLTRLEPEHPGTVTLRARASGHGRINQAGRDLHIGSGD